MNYSMGYPTPEVGETIWLRCPYTDELCGTEGTATVESIETSEVVMVFECVNGHRWRITKLGENWRDY